MVSRLSPGSRVNRCSRIFGEVNEDDLAAFASHFYYQSHDVTSVDHYKTLKKLASDLDEKYACQGNRIFYLAMAPSFFGTIAEHIATST